MSQQVSSQVRHGWPEQWVAYVHAPSLQVIPPVDALSLRVRFTGNSTRKVEATLSAITGNSTRKLTGEVASEATSITGDSTRKLTGGFSPFLGNSPDSDSTRELTGNEPPEP